MARLTWKREADEKGLAAVAQTPRGRILRLSGVDLAIVKGIDRRLSGFYWYTMHPDAINVPRMNTARTPAATEAEAMAEAEAHFRKYLTGTPAE